MPRKAIPIPVISLPADPREGIIIARTAVKGLPDVHIARAHRDGGHSFVLQEKGTTHIEIDFQLYAIKAPALLYIHPNQVHRVIRFENAILTSCILTAENLQPAYLQLLEDLASVNTVPLSADTFSILAAMASLCIQLAARKQEQLYDAILKESCNTLVALIISQYAALSKPAEHYSRAEIITKAFKAALAQDFMTVKSPMAYAAKLNISTPYLNECVKAVTGYSVSHHIQQRVVLEAKRLLHHSDRSIKEIAGGLGYDDYSYFTRLFVKAAGMTPQAFRGKNLD